MASLFTAKMDVAPLKKALRDALKEAKKAVKDELKSSAERITQDARSRCTIPSIRATIRSQLDGQGFSVSAGQGLAIPDIAAYHEFGTGDFARATVANLPEDWKVYAWTFKKERDGRLPGKPYLYPAFYDEMRYLKGLKML